VTANHGALSMINACASGRTPGSSSSDAIERHGAGACPRAARTFVEFHQHGRAAHFAEAAMRARYRFEERDKLLAGKKAEIGGGNPRPRTEWRAMRLLALPAMAMRGSHQGVVNLEAHPAA
jgi:hypothetical protein